MKKIFSVMASITAILMFSSILAMILQIKIIIN